MRIRMFLLKVNKSLFRGNCQVRYLNLALGKSETEIIEKWKRKFASENISEIEESIKHILDHVQKEVNIFSSEFT